MTDSIKQRTAALSITEDAFALRKLFEQILADIAELGPHAGQFVADITAVKAREQNSMISNPGLAIGGGSKLTAQAVKPFMVIAGGVLQFVPAATSMSVLPASTVAQGKFGMWCWYINSTGTITTSAATADADTAAAAFLLMPAIPANRAMIGCMILTTTNAAGWVAGTDAIDAGAAQTVIYINNIGLKTAPVAVTYTASDALGLIA
jgi:hypothetical protein